MKKISFFLFVLPCFTFLHAQQNVSFKNTFDHLALSAKDVNRSAEFYKNVLDLNEIQNRSKIEGMRWFSLGGNMELHLIPIGNKKISIDTSIHFAFANKNFNEFIRKIRAMNISFEDANGNQKVFSIRADGVKQIYLPDPDGYWVEINNAGEDAAVIELVKNEVWQLEEDYWKYVKNKDLKSYLTLWDDQFIGYPSTNKIGGKDNITDWITGMYKDRKTSFNYELTRHIENVFDNIVIVLYDVTQIWTNDNNEVVERSTFKITHTWKKTGKAWQIIGGMGAKK
jgi:lactoylglutathione lyase